MAQQTAVEWFVNNLPERFKNAILNTCQEEVTQAIQMERQQIQKAFSDGQETPINHPTIPHYSREEYFNETYNR